MTSTAPLTVVAPRRSLRDHVTGVWRYRELLGGLVRKELKVKYKNSALGFFWSMLNPAMYLAVFYVVFQLVLQNGIELFAVYLLSGLLVWNLFSTSLSSATSSIVSNGPLVNKVWFPREILPLASVGANLVHFLLQGLVLVAALLVFTHGPDWQYVWLIPPALAVLLIFAAALAVLLAALNVYARDAQHLLELGLLAWFWMTPIVYPWFLTANQLTERGLPSTLTLVNPVTPVVLAFQRAIYGRVVSGEGDDLVRLLPDESALWYLRNLGIVGVAATVLLVVALKVFGRLEGDFSEEL
jgi:ABC-2 type transport system permease protein